MAILEEELAKLRARKEQLSKVGQEQEDSDYSL